MKRPISIARLATSLALGLALCTTSCAYVKDRVLDMSDVVDIKYGFGVGLGAKVEATNWVGVGVGYGVMPKTREWYGRKSHVAYDQEFMHFVVAGRDGTSRAWGEPGQDGTDHYNIVLPVNISALDHAFTPPFLQWWRFGFEIIIPAADFGLFINGGELVDFFTGIFLLDLADDDGVPKSEQYGDHFANEEDEDG